MSYRDHSLANPQPQVLVNNFWVLKNLFINELFFFMCSNHLTASLLNDIKPLADFYLVFAVRCIIITKSYIDYNRFCYITSIHN